MDGYIKLEKEYSKYVGSEYAVTCNSGTSALHLALMAVGVGKEDEVIVPDFTMAACGFAVAYTGAKVVTVDCGDDLNIDVSKIEDKITSKTKAIMAVHIYGRLCDILSIRDIADKHNLKVIEDASEAHGAVFFSLADITCYSFYQNKIINAEEGGICTTDNKEYADKMNYLKNMAFNKAHNFFHTSIGYNYRMPNSQAKLALKSLRNVEKNLRKRRKWELSFKFDNMPYRDVVWVFDIDGGDEKKELMKQFKDVRCFFKPLSTFPMFGQEIGKNALKWSKRGFYIKY